MRRVLCAFVAFCSAALVALGPAALPAAASNDTFFDQQWNLAAIHAPDAWGVSTGAGIDIGIVDTGIDLNHPDVGAKVDASANCIGGTCTDGGADDGHGHGTVVAGIAAAITGNGRGIAGVAPDARLIIAKAVDDTGKGDVNDIINGIHWVVDHGARVVNLSLGDSNFLVTSLLGTPLRPGIEYAWSKGAIPVLASGNENVGVLDLGSSNYGNLDAVVVGATDKTGAVASYSSPLGNAKWGLVAPGGNGGGTGQDVLSTYPDDRYAWVAGTSMAAPEVSGALAMLLAEGMTPMAAVQRVLDSADRSVKCGTGCAGLLNVAAAVGRGNGTGSGTIPTTAPSTPTTRAVTRTTVAPTTTTVPDTSTTTAPVPVVPEPKPGQQTAAAGTRLEAPVNQPRNSLVIVLAVALLTAVGSAAGVTAWDRLRAGAGP